MENKMVKLVEICVVAELFNVIFGSKVVVENRLIEAGLIETRTVYHGHSRRKGNPINNIVPWNKRFSNRSHKHFNNGSNHNKTTEV